MENTGYNVIYKGNIIGTVATNEVANTDELLNKFLENYKEATGRDLPDPENISFEEIGFDTAMDQGQAFSQKDDGNISSYGDFDKSIENGAFDDVEDYTEKKYRIFDIDYDVSGEENEEEVLSELPKELIVSTDASENELDEKLGDLIGEETGFSVNGFQFEEIEDEVEEDNVKVEEESFDAEIEEVCKLAGSKKLDEMHGLDMSGTEPSDTYEEFLKVRENALANPNLYDGRYTQDDIEVAYEQFKEDKLRGNK